VNAVPAERGVSKPRPQRLAGCATVEVEPDRPVDLGCRKAHVMTVWAAVALSVLATVIARVAGRGNVEANGSVGIRTPALRSSDAAWRAGHRAAVPILVALTIVSAAAGGVVFAATWGKGSDATNMAGLWVIGLVGAGIVLATVRANSVAASTDPETR
jgi:hypothetical protein